MWDEKRHRIHPVIRQRARELRQPQTRAEAILWRQLRDRRLKGLKFRRQHPIGHFIVDFHCPKHQLVVEIDGDTHATHAEYDEARTERLEMQGHRIIRFTNQEVYFQLSAVLEAIWAACEQHTLDGPEAD